MAVDFEIIDNNELQFGVGASDELEFGTRDIIEIRQSGDYEDLTNKPSINGVTLIGDKTTEDLHIEAGVTSWNGQTGDVVYTPPEAPVQSVNGQTGAVVLDASDVGALPDSTAIPTKTSDLTNDSGYITGINSSDVTSALGYTPYNSTNPNGYVNATQAANIAPVQSVNGKTGVVSLSASDVSALPSNTPIHNVPSGGTSGQVLTKSSNSDYAVEWSTPSGAVTSVNGQTGVVVLDADDVGALPSSTVIPSKTSDLTNDSNFITASQAPVQSVNGETGTVVLDAEDVGALPDDTVIPSKTSDLTNDSGFINTAVFYGTCASSASATTKVVDCEDFTEADLKAGATILVRFSTTNTGAVASLKLNVNGTGAKTIQYINNGTRGNLGNAGYLKASTAYPFIYDGTYWLAQFNYNSNTTYSAMTTAEMQTGTSTAARLITPAVLKSAVKYHAPAIPTEVSAFENDAGYLTLATLPIWDGGVI